VKNVRATNVTKGTSNQSGRRRSADAVTYDASVTKAVALAVLVCALAGATTGAAARTTIPQSYSEKLMSACLFKARVFAGYAFGRGPTEPAAMTGEIDLHDYGFRGVRPIGDGVLVFEKSHLDAVRDAPTLAGLLTFPPPAYQERIMGNVVVLLNPHRANRVFGEKVLATCFARSRTS
jgi:hypothetical protein